jgi:hypothetical protein
MCRAIFATLLLLALAGQVTAAHYFANITAVDAKKGTVTYTVTFGKEKDTEVKAPVAKNCVIKEGYYRLGKPATTKEGDDIADGLKNAIFKNATAQKPVKVNVYTADADDPDAGVKKGDIVKILVNPPPKK